MTNIRLRYQTIEFGETDIHLCTLRDKQQYQDLDDIAGKLGINSALWPIFGVVWPSSIVLAQFIAEYNIDAKRILEVGCGIALPSLLLNSMHADITATDYHPEVESFLERNTSLNSNFGIPFERSDWANKNDQLGTFDLIMGSDLLYEDQHIKLLSRFIDYHAKRTCEIILVDPGRGRKNKMKIAMSELGYTSSDQKLPHQRISEPEFKGHIIKFVR